MSNALAATIKNDGYDPHEACVNSVCIECKSGGDGNYDRTFTDKCLEQEGKDTRHSVDSVSHNTLNLVNQNIKAGLTVCAYDPPAVAGECGCGADADLDVPRTNREYRKELHRGNMSR